ncbi:hypothetical protein CU097_007529 [Rhizopus azygosporus]|uniref:Uncharacterized protein n=1 Tax=Rhizopus azygosporus TaxID=86630 RepID=A0A367J2J4_RHIAZ|nr:hypothetical protein CU097_007529 [Rhizopus azygosporus]
MNEVQNDPKLPASKSTPQGVSAFKLLSLNGNGFFKVSKPSTRRQFIWHIRSCNPIFATLQEMDNSDNPFFQFDLLHQHPVYFDPSFSITRIPIPEDARCFLAQVTLINDFIEPFFILAIYTPANVARERHEFLKGFHSFSN